MTSLTPSRPSRSAFTLIELLVVIAIIAILAGIALPVMAAARARADGAACSSNLRMIGTAIAAYASDHDNLLPGPFSAEQKPMYINTDNSQMAEVLATYLGLPAPTGTSQKAPIMTCPAYAKADPTLQRPVYAIDPLYQAVVGQGLVSFFSNAGQIWAFGNPSGANAGNSNNDNTGVANNPNGTTPLRIAALTALIDQRGNPADLSHMIVMRDFIGGQGASTQPVHKSYVNALFFDWHVGTLTPTTLMPQ